MTRAATSRATAGSALLCVLAIAAIAGSGCGTTRAPEAIGASELAEAQTFPYYRIYWTGPTFQGEPLVAADGRKSYNIAVGDSVYYGDCARGHGVFGGGGSCRLPLQVTTVIYRLHSNAPLGPQRNLLIRGVPATVYDEGNSIELYSGRLAIDIFADSYARARAAALRLRPLNAAGAATGPLPAPVYCPGLYGPQEPRLRRAMANLPGRACQTAAAELAFADSLRLTAGSNATSAAVAPTPAHRQLPPGRPLGERPTPGAMTRPPSRPADPARGAG